MRPENYLGIGNKKYVDVRKKNILKVWLYTQIVVGLLWYIKPISQLATPTTSLLNWIVFPIFFNWENTMLYRKNKKFGYFIFNFFTILFLIVLGELLVHINGVLSFAIGTGLSITKYIFNPPHKLIVIMRLGLIVSSFMTIIFGIIIFIIGKFLQKDNIENLKV